MTNMKKGIVYFFMMAVSLVLFAGCGSDNNEDGPEEPTDYALQVAGTYPGQLKITLPGDVELPEQDNQVTITRNAENIINLKLNAFTLTVPDTSAESASLGLRSVPTIDIVIADILVEAIEVSKSGSDVVLTEKTVEVDVTMDGMPGKYNVTVSEGKVNGSNLSMNIKVPMNDGEVKVVFTGTKK